MSDEEPLDEELTLDDLKEIYDCLESCEVEWSMDYSEQKRKVKAMILLEDPEWEEE